MDFLHMEFYFCVFSYHTKTAVIVHKMLQYMQRGVARVGLEDAHFLSYRQ